MKGVVFTTSEKMCVKDFGEPLYKTIGEVVGGYIEIVRPRGLKNPYVIIVNEEGLLHGLELNPIGSVWYQTWKHGCPIVGDVVVMKEGVNEDGDNDVLGLTELEIQEVKAIALRDSGGLIKDVDKDNIRQYFPDLPASEFPWEDQDNG